MDHGSPVIRALAGAALAALISTAPAGCGTTRATGDSPSVRDDGKGAVKAAPTPEGEAVDAALAREGEKWMVELAKRRAVAQPAANAVTRPAALPVERAPAPAPPPAVPRRP